jgi:hypothetical protein
VRCTVLHCQVLLKTGDIPAAQATATWVREWSAVAAGRIFPGMRPVIRQAVTLLPGDPSLQEVRRGSLTGRAVGLTCVSRSCSLQPGNGFH